MDHMVIVFSGNGSVVFLFFKIKKIFLMFIFERERERENGGGAERQRETPNLKQATGSELSAQSPMQGSNP